MLTNKESKGKVAESLEMPTVSQVNKAGEILRKNDCNAEKLTAALETLSRWRTAHSHVLENVHELLSEYCTELEFSDAVIAKRLKRLSSIVYKLNRFSGRLSKIQDIAGIRVILKSQDEVERFYNKLVDSQFIKKHTVSSADYIQSPKKDGYRSIHLVYKDCSSPYGELKAPVAEIQIRTRLQHAWATAVETLGVIEHTHFKSGAGDESFKRFFKLCSALFSIYEKTPVLEELRGSSKEDLVAEFEELEQRLNIFTRLKEVTVATHRILTKGQNQGYYQLLELNTKLGTVTVIPFAKDEAKDAGQMYTAKEVSLCPDIMVVLVSVGDLTKVMQAYPNYFLDADIFIKELKIICQSIKSSVPYQK